MSILGKRLVVILGPTAIGKTALAIELAQEFRTEIISADSRQFFKEISIGVARPSNEELEAVKHYFINFISIEDEYSAGRYEADANNLLKQLFEKHDTVVCCGGSMLYVDALVNGLDDLPGDKLIRLSLQNELAEQGLMHLQNRLKELDPVYYTQVDLHNPHRVMRAIEVCLATGNRYSDLRKRTFQERSFDVIKIGLTAERAWLYARINQRVDIMMKNGLLEEVIGVYTKRNLNALNTVGYKELFDYLDGNSTLEESIEKIKQHTRNFAKRQLTWWRRDDSIKWIEVDKCDNLKEQALSILT